MGKPQPIEAPSEDKIVTGLTVRVRQCELCSPKADNTSMAGGRGLSKTRCASEDAGPLRGGWMMVVYIGGGEERTTPHKRGETSTHRGAFWGQNREGRTGLRVSVPWGEVCAPKQEIPQ